MSDRIFSGQTQMAVPRKVFDENFERTFGTRNENMHKNEVKITTGNRDDLMLEAMERGPEYIKAFREQMARQEAEAHAEDTQESSS